MYQFEFFCGGVFVIIEIYYVVMQISGFYDMQIDCCCIYIGGNQCGQECCVKFNYQGYFFIIGNMKEKGE